MSEVSKVVGEFIVNNVSLSVLIFLFILSGLFKIAKIEVNPIGWALAAIGRALTKDVQNSFKELKTSVDSLKDETNQKIQGLKDDLDEFERKTDDNIDQMKKSNDLQTVRQIRTHILDFANSCRNGIKHTHEDFRNILEENSEYESLIEKYGIKNDYYTEDLKYIKRIYQHCLDTNGFLA